MTLFSPAKVNWSLRVRCRRADGFHDIESLVSTVSLCDQLEFEQRAGAGIELICDNPDVPGDARNLIARAATLLAERSGHSCGMRCRLEKRIPIGGGLGGGSSNAATTLVALNTLWGLNWPVERLVPLAAELGSDVAFFVRGGSAVMSGRGETLHPVKLGWNGWIVLIVPPFSLSTAAVYAEWRPETSPIDAPVWTDRPLADSVAWMERSFNMLEAPAMRIRPVLREIRDGLQKLAGRVVRMSGSGSTLFTAFDERAEAVRFAEAARNAMELQTVITQPVGDDLGSITEKRGRDQSSH